MRMKSLTNYLYSNGKLYSFQLTLFALAWANINSGFWNLRDVSTSVQVVHFLRAIMPYVLPLIGIIYWSRTKDFWQSLNPVSWLAAYGWIALAASVFSPKFEASFYFGAAFMMNMLIPAVFFAGNKRVNVGGCPENILLYATWIIVGIYVLAIYVFMRDSLGVGYGIYGMYANGVGGMAVSRSSGLARFFGVVGLLCFARIWQGSDVQRLVFAVPMFFCVWVVWNMQSRGGMFGFFAGVLLLFLFSRSSWRFYILISLAVIIVFAGGWEKKISNRLVKQITRDQSEAQLYSMTGRTRAYKAGWRQVKKHPIIGQGNWADRVSINEHVHNSYLQALMNAGILGFIPYVLSWIMGWYLFYRLYKLRRRMQPEDQQLFMEASAVMMFFTVRSIPETTTASFSVDSMIMVPVYFYLFMLYQRTRSVED